MLDFNSSPNYQGPTTTSNSSVEGRLKVGVAQRARKKAILKGILKKDK